MVSNYYARKGDLNLRSQLNETSGTTRFSYTDFVAI